MPQNRRDITGMKLNKLTAIKRLEASNKKNSYWEFQCDCGSITTGIMGNFLKGTWISCGCSKNPRGPDSKNWKGVGDLSATFVTRIRENAKRRRILFDVSIDYLWQLVLDQDHKCTLSGLDLIFPRTFKDISIGNRTASLDRIDSSLGYIEGNVQWVHKDVNMMKQQFDQKYFIELCEAIVERRNSNV